MSQCHDIYTFDHYGVGPARRVRGTHCHDQAPTDRDRAGHDRTGHHRTGQAASDRPAGTHRVKELQPA
jgi:hypothetical protein